MTFTFWLSSALLGLGSVVWFFLKGGWIALLQGDPLRADFYENMTLLAILATVLATVCLGLGVFQ
jgi:hypothetical protein